MFAVSQDQLHAFEAIVRSGSFTRAAVELHLSQPALSRRIAKLEERLESVLLVRGRSGVGLTEPGRALFAYAKAQAALEEELLADLAPSNSLRGLFRVAGLSSLLPAVVLPELAPLLRANPALQIELHPIECDHLGQDVADGAADFGLSERPSEVAGAVEVLLGEELYVMIESREHVGRADVFLDTSPRDRTTEWFLAAQPRGVVPKRWSRSFLHDELGILHGVELGIGRAVKPRHTIPVGAAVRIDPAYAAVQKPVYLLERRQRYHGRMFQRVRELIVGAVRARLGRPNPAGRRAKRP
jgi:DNA-binding transcriptional LysR family regulator